MMETQLTTNRYSDKLAWGLTLLAVALLVELVTAGYALATLNVEFDPSSIQTTANAINPFLILLSCLTPLGFLLKIVAIVLIVSDARRLDPITNGLHRRLAWTAVALFVISLLMQGGTIALSFSGTSAGSQSALTAASWISLVSSLLGIVAVVLLIYAISGSNKRIVMIAAAILYAAGTVGATFLTVQNTTMESYEIMDRTFFAPVVNLDRTQGIYPVLSAAGTLAIAVLFIILLMSAIQAWRSISKELPESVA
jgi:hypothetical protein